MGYKMTKTTVEEREEKEKEKKMTKEKPTAQIPQLTEEEYKSNINQDFKENKVYLNVIEEAVSTLTKKGQSQLPDLVNAIKFGLRPKFKKDENGNVVSADFGASLSDAEIENFVIYLPVEMYTALEFIQTKALDAEYSKYIAELKQSEKILMTSGGTVQERQKVAEIETMFPSISALIKNRVYQNIKGEIEAANRIYEALKKVLQARIEDKKVFGKNSNYQ